MQYLSKKSGKYTASKNPENALGVIFEEKKEEFIGAAVMGISPSFPDPHVQLLASPEVWRNIDFKKLNQLMQRSGCNPVVGRFLTTAAKGSKAKYGVAEVREDGSVITRDYVWNERVEFRPIGKVGPKGSLLRLSDEKEWTDYQLIDILYCIGRRS